MCRPSILGIARGGGYEPPATGATYLLGLAAAGTYTIAVRQDNPGLPAAGRTLYGLCSFQAAVSAAANWAAAGRVRQLGQPNRY